MLTPPTLDHGAHSPRALRLAARPGLCLSPTKVGNSEERRGAVPQSVLPWLLWAYLDRQPLAGRQLGQLLLSVGIRVRLGRRLRPQQLPACAERECAGML